VEGPRLTVQWRSQALQWRRQWLPRFVLSGCINYPVFLFSLLGKNEIFNAVRRIFQGDACEQAWAAILAPSAKRTQPQASTASQRFCIIHLRPPTSHPVARRVTPSSPLLGSGFKGKKKIDEKIGGEKTRTQARQALQWRDRDLHWRA
jgi:hypothetical protein